KRISRDYILYINEVSRLLAVSENRDRLVPHCFLNKSRNDSGVFTSRILVGTKDIKITKGNSGESPFLREEAAAPFAFILACGIWTFRLGRHGFNSWNRRIVAVNCSRAAEDQLFCPRPRRLLQNNRCTPSVDLGVVIRLLHGSRHAYHGRQM